MDELLAKLNTPVKELWEKNKLFVIVFGLVILVVKFREVLFDLLVSGSKKLVSDATQKNDSLLKEENQANDQADKLVKEAQELNNNKPSVDENWNKK